MNATARQVDGRRRDRGAGDRRGTRRVARPLRWHGAGESQPGSFGIMLLSVGGAALIARRRYPGAVLGVVLADDAGGECARREVRVAGADRRVLHRGAARAAVGCDRVAGHRVRRAVWHASAEFALLLAAGLVTLLSVAEVSRAWRDRAAADRRGRDEAVRRRASEERLAIARDLHDVVAHSISVINVQANTALHLMDRQPERAREALTAIREVSGQALAELGAVLGALRDTGAPLAPAPGVARLDDLAARAQVGGVRRVGGRLGRGAGAARRGGRGGVPDRAGGADQHGAAFRRARGERAAAVRGRRPGDRGVDDGGGASGGRPAGGPGAAGAPAHRVGNGLAGMAERARALGGTFHAGPGLAAGSGCSRRLPAMIRVALADDQALVRSGFAALLDAEDDISVVGSAADGFGAVRLARCTAGRAADGHPDAGTRRHRGDAGDRRRRRTGGRARGHPDHVRS